MSFVFVAIGGTFFVGLVILECVMRLPSLTGRCWCWCCSLPCIKTPMVHACRVAVLVCVLRLDPCVDFTAESSA